jgi:hypothetical protein
MNFASQSNWFSATFFQKYIGYQNVINNLKLDVYLTSLHLKLYILIYLFFLHKIIK